MRMMTLWVVKPPGVEPPMLSVTQESWVRCLSITCGLQQYRCELCLHFCTTGAPLHSCCEVLICSKPHCHCLVEDQLGPPGSQERCC